MQEHLGCPVQDVVGFLASCTALEKALQARFPGMTRLTIEMNEGSLAPPYPASIRKHQHPKGHQGTTGGNLNPKP